MTSQQTKTQNFSEQAETTENLKDSPYASLSYEQAREKLDSIVQKLDSGNQSLEDSMKLWEEGQGLATYCETLLLGAQKQLNEATEAQQEEQ